ncbi:hypothetical protein B0H12DRAFT_1076503 [Mycena haematopus]|nr:hypothetical protein B0H12DRAFT_1076503 [Mycena haematopus]
MAVSITSVDTPPFDSGPSRFELRRHSFGFLPSFSLHRFIYSQWFSTNIRWSGRAEANNENDSFGSIPSTYPQMRVIGECNSWNKALSLVVVHEGIRGARVTAKNEHKHANTQLVLIGQFISSNGLGRSVRIHTKCSTFVLSSVDIPPFDSGPSRRLEVGPPCVFTVPDNFLHERCGTKGTFSIRTMKKIPRWGKFVSSHPSSTPVSPNLL